MDPLEPSRQESSPWHAGETAMQEAFGVSDRMRELGPRVLRDHLIDQHRAFFPQLPIVVLGTVDPAGDAWATLRAAPPGFLQSPDPHHLRVALDREPMDPAEAGLDDGRSVALLGIELHTRRRNRLNGVIRRDAASQGFTIDVRQSFGNCPKYIQLRDFRFEPEPASPRVVHSSTELDDRSAEIVANADTFFVASYVEGADGTRQVDVSHRGGKPGFVRIGDDGVLTIPDFVGNFFFNTLGNLLVNPRAGFVFVDFETGDLLQLTGDTEIVLDSAEVDAFEGAQRLWRLKPRRVVLRPGALGLRFSLRENGLSPFLVATGDWKSAGEG